MAANLKCEYRFLGGSGLKVSNICLGCMTFGEFQYGEMPPLPGQCDEAASHAILDRYVELGGNFLDTADIYAFGKSEEYIGSWLAKQEREKLVVATKCRIYTGKDINRCGLSRHHIMHSIDDSLRRLRTDHVDLYQIHAWDDAVPLEETLSVLNDLVRAGKVRYLGASNVKGWQLQKIVELSKYMGLNKWISLQAEYSLVSRGIEWELTDVCRREGIGIIPWSPLKGGLLTGKFTREGEMEEGCRITVLTKSKKTMATTPNLDETRKDDKFWTMMDVMKKVAKDQSKTVAQVALRWLLQKDVVPSVIIGAKTVQQLEDNMGASTGWEITDEQMAELDAASQPAAIYPYNIIPQFNIDRVRKNFCQ